MEQNRLIARISIDEVGRVYVARVYDEYGSHIKSFNFYTELTRQNIIYAAMKQCGLSTVYAVNVEFPDEHDREVGA